MNLTERIRFTRKAVAEAALAGVAEGHLAAFAVRGSLGRHRKLTVGVAAFTLLSAAGWSAAATCADISGSGPVGPLADMLRTAGLTMITLGGLIALVMIALGATWIMIAAGHEGRVKRGMNMIKHSIYAVAFLAAGVFIREIVVNLVASGAGGVTGTAPGSNDPSSCITNDGLTATT